METRKTSPVFDSGKNRAHIFSTKDWDFFPSCQMSFPKDRKYGIYTAWLTANWHSQMPNTFFTTATSLYLSSTSTQISFQIDMWSAKLNVLDTLWLHKPLVFYLC